MILLKIKGNKIMKIIRNEKNNEYCLYDEGITDFGSTVLFLKGLYGNKNIIYYETTSDAFVEDCKIEEIKGNKRVNLAEWY